MTEERKHLEELEARAVDQAKATADSAYRPSAAILNAPSPAVLLEQVDGPPLHEHDTKESIYVGRSIPIAAGGHLQVPIQVTNPGSVVEYEVTLKGYDVAFGIVAERQEGTTIVRDQSRMDATETVSQKFLVGTVPCLIQFVWDNSYSWMREKVLSYKITVTPPTATSLLESRRRRAAACYKAVHEDMQQAVQRLNAAQQHEKTLAAQVEELQEALRQRQEELQTAEKETAWLQERYNLRVEQEKLLKNRLEHGWDDEQEIATS